MKKALLVYGYGLKNAGDMAITLGAIDLLKENYKVTVLSRFDADHPEYEKSKKYLLSKYPDIYVEPSPFKLNRDAGIKTNIKNHLSGGIQVIGLLKNQNVESLVNDSDLVVFNGGNLFRCESFSDFARLSALMYPLSKAQEFNIPYVIFPQSASTINWIGKKSLKGILRQAKRVWTREDQSFQYLQNRLNLENLEKAIDLAFFLNASNNGSTLGIKRATKKIAVTLRGYTVGDLKKFSTEKKQYIKNTIIQTLKDINHHYEASFRLVVQTEKDKNLTVEVLEEIESELDVSLIEEYDPLKLIKLYKECNMLIGMRLHSIIMALNSGTPAVGFFDREWGLKNPGLMEKFDLPYKFLNAYKANTLIEESAKILDNETSIRKQVLKVIDNEEEKFNNFLKSALI